MLSLLRVVHQRVIQLMYAYDAKAGEPLDQCDAFQPPWAEF